MNNQASDINESRTRADTRDALSPRCGYDLYQHRLGSPSCLRCYPTRDYHTYAEQLDRLHPWKRQPIAEW
jgi:hypothetical protein